MTKEIFASYRDFYRHQLLDDCVPFWEQSDLLDRQYGGYITSVDREGKSYNDDKSVWFQGRCLWTVFRADEPLRKKGLVGGGRRGR